MRKSNKINEISFIGKELKIDGVKIDLNKPESEFLNDMGLIYNFKTDSLSSKRTT